MSDKKEYSLDHISNVGHSYYTGGAAFYMPRLMQSLLSSDDKILSDFSIAGILSKSLDELLSFMESNGGRKVVAKYLHDYVYVWKDYSFVNIDFNKHNNNVTISGYYTDKIFINMIAVLEKEFVSKVKKNLVFTIMRSSSSLEIKSMGNGSAPLIVDNYLPEVLEEVDYVISAFSKTPPGGRICILNGEPGTGKTHLIRSILMRMDCVFLIVPTNLIDSLDKPEFMPLLMNIKNEHEKPIIMIIEDGDVCLVPRKNDNISTISSLLNLSDGILGSMIDIKMIISTNAEIRDMDQAILRPGRLCRNIHVGPLPYEQANRVYQRLTNSSDAKLEYRKYYTLAEIYDMVNNIGLTPIKHHNMKRIIGFSSVTSNQDLILNKSVLEIK